MIEPEIGKTCVFVHSDKSSKVVFAEYTLLNDGSENVYLRYRDGRQFGVCLSERDRPPSDYWNDIPRI